MELSTAAIMPYAATAFKAVVVAVVGYIAAVIGEKVTVKLLGNLKSLREQQDFVKSAGNLIYYLTLLVTVVAVLEALGLKYVTQPFLDLLNKIATYVPNVIGATVILVLGVLLAKIAREFTNSLVETLQLGELGKKYGIENLGKALGNLVYVLVVLFVIVAALNALQINAVTAPAVSMLTAILNAIPRIVAALIVFGITFYIGKLVADISAKIVDDLNIDEIAKEIGLSSDKLKFADLVKYAILAFAVLIGLSQAFHYLEAEALYQLTYRFTIVAFKIVVAAVVLFVGAYLGNAFEKKVENEAIGRIIKVAFITAAVFIALPYIGVSPRVIEIVVLSISLGVGLAFALAFGLGGKEVAVEVLRKLVKSDKKGE